MTRFLPKSLIGQTLLILLLGLDVDRRELPRIIP
jgi:hypothetical protein